MVLEKDKFSVVEKANEQKFPLISCIMPTANRSLYVNQSIQYFLQQDYPNKELIIVYDNVSDIPAISFPHNVKLIHTCNTILGAKRNLACRYAEGSIIAHWDDDDVYNTHRLTIQALPIIRGEADITGLQSFVFYEVPTGRGWLPQKSLFSEIFVGNVHGGSLVFNRLVWEQLAIYPHYALAEDAHFLRNAIRRRALLLPVNGYDSYMYIRHTGNTWKFEKNNFQKYTGWMPARVPVWAQKYLTSYWQGGAVPQHIGSGNPYLRFQI